MNKQQKQFVTEMEASAIGELIDALDQRNSYINQLENELTLTFVLSFILGGVAGALVIATSLPMLLSGLVVLACAGLVLVVMRIMEQ